MGGPMSGVPTCGCQEWPICGHGDEPSSTPSAVDTPSIVGVVVGADDLCVCSHRRWAHNGEFGTCGPGTDCWCAEFRTDLRAEVERLTSDFKVLRETSKAAHDRAESAEAELARVNAGRALEQAALSRALPIVTAAHDAKAALLEGGQSASARARGALLILERAEANAAAAHGGTE